MKEYTLKNNVRMHGKIYQAGEKILLNDEQAEVLKECVKTKKIKKDGDTINSND